MLLAVNRYLFAISVLALVYGRLFFSFSFFPLLFLLFIGVRTMGKSKWYIKYIYLHISCYWSRIDVNKVSCLLVLFTCFFLFVCFFFFFSSFSPTHNIQKKYAKKKCISLFWVSAFVFSIFFLSFSSFFLERETPFQGNRITEVNW